MGDHHPWCQGAVVRRQAPTLLAGDRQRCGAAELALADFVFLDRVFWLVRHRRRPSSSSAPTLKMPAPPVRRRGSPHQASGRRNSVPSAAEAQKPAQTVGSPQQRRGPSSPAADTRWPGGRQSKRAGTRHHIAARRRRQNLTIHQRSGQREPGTRSQSSWSARRPAPQHPRGPVSIVVQHQTGGQRASGATINRLDRAERPVSRRRRAFHRQGARRRHTC